ncbi:MAG: GDSL-type esterase/lipase family protein [Balneolaceae bacterium]
MDKAEKEALEKYFLQFLNFEKQYPLLPGFREAGPVATLLGLERDELSGLRDRFRSNAEEAASELLDEEEIEERLQKLPFRSGEKIVAIGDSMTDDLQGWCSIFSELLNKGTDLSDIEVINSGVSYNTTSEALRRLHRDVLSLNPDWVMVSLGTFDAIRLNIAPDRTLLPLSETWENLNTIQSAIEQVTEQPVIWISPPPVIGGLLDEMELFDFQIDEKDLFSIREVIAGKRGYHVDPAGTRMGNPAEAWYYLSDGVNPSLSGHTNTVRALVKALSTDLETNNGSD